MVFFRWKPDYALKNIFQIGLLKGKSSRGLEKIRDDK